MHLVSYAISIETSHHAAVDCPQAVLAARTDEAHRAVAAVGQRLGGAEQLIHRLAVTIHGGGAGRGPLATYEGVLRALSPDARVRCPRPSDLTCGICICSRPLRS